MKYRVWRRTEDDGRVWEWYFRLTENAAYRFVRECMLAGVPVWVSPALPRVPKVVL